MVLRDCFTISFSLSTDWACLVIIFGSLRFDRDDHEQKSLKFLSFTSCPWKMFSLPLLQISPLFLGDRSCRAIPPRRFPLENISVQEMLDIGRRIDHELNGGAGGNWLDSNIPFRINAVSDPIKARGWHSRINPIPRVE